MAMNATTLVAPASTSQANRRRSRQPSTAVAAINGTAISPPGHLGTHRQGDRHAGNHIAQGLCRVHRRQGGVEGTAAWP